MRSFEEITEDLDSDGFGHYLAGFIDGEGCFVIAQAKGAYVCRAQVKLRDDDAAILFELQRRTGLGLVRPEKVYAGARVKACPQMTWIICNKSDCAMFVRLLERYPLRAKKRLDFDIWRLAVSAWCSKRRYGGWDTIAALRQQLIAGRRYEDEYSTTFTFEPELVARMEEFDLGSAA